MAVTLMFLLSVVSHVSSHRFLSIITRTFSMRCFVLNLRKPLLEGQELGFLNYKSHNFNHFKVYD